MTATPVSPHDPELERLRTEEAARHPWPGARAPDRTYRIDSSGIGLAVYEWGRHDAPPVLLVHGALDFARTFDVFAPLVADAGFRVVSYDHRGHGDSDHTDLYSWVADERDMLAVANAISPHAFAAIGHSKGGSMLAHTIQAMPHRFTRFVAMDGLPFRSPHPESAKRERKSMTAEKIAEWLDHRRTAAGSQRKPGTIEELARRRARMNPRLSMQWLCYIATHGARRDADGWRWKIDPSLRTGGFGPFRSRWITDRLPGFPIPMLALFGTETEPMGWDVTADELRPWLPESTQVAVLQDTGHFLHIERPHETAALVIEFLRS